MTTAFAQMSDRLELEFRAACEGFALARASQRLKDTPAARRRVAERLAAVNATLDRALDQSHRQSGGRSGVCGS